jgi:hypothetical protein
LKPALGCHTDLIQTRNGNETHREIRFFNDLLKKENSYGNELSMQVSVLQELRVRAGRLLLLVQWQARCLPVHLLLLRHKIVVCTPGFIMERDEGAGIGT